MVESTNIKIFLFLRDEEELKKEKSVEICGKGDLNSRTPTRMDSKSTTFDQTWRFPLFELKL